jgi:hypothetical protein
MQTREVKERFYPVYQDPTIHTYRNGTMNVNEMNSMVFGSPTDFRLPIGCYKLANGGMINGPLRSQLNLTSGGKLESYLGRPPKEIYVKMKTAKVDQIPALLQGGEIVVPKKYANRVSKMLKKANIHLPNM